MNALQLVFDLDDTLYPERAFVESGLAAAARLLADEGIAGAHEAILAARGEAHDGRIFDRALLRLGLEASPERVRALVDVYRFHPEPRIEPYEDARGLLASLPADRPLALVSDGFERAQRNKLHSLGLSARFRHTVFTFDRGPGWHKPAPAAFEAIARATGAGHERCVYVADNAAKDFTAPAALGWTTVLIRRTDGVHRGPAPHGVRIDHVLDDLRELPAVLGTPARRVASVPSRPGACGIA